MKNIFKKTKIKNKIKDINNGDKNRDFVFSDDIYLSKKGKIRNFHNIVIDQTQIGSKQYVENNIENINDSFIIEDLEGLYFNKFSQNLKDKGYCVRTIEFKEEKMSEVNYYDPLVDINDEDDFRFLASLIISSIENAPYLNLFKNDPFWLFSSTSLLESLMHFIFKYNNNSFENLIQLLQAKDLDKIQGIDGMSQSIKALGNKTLKIVVENCYYKVLNFKERVLKHIDKNDVTGLEQIINQKTAIFLIRPFYKSLIIGFSDMFYYLIYSKIRNANGKLTPWRFFINEDNYDYDYDYDFRLFHTLSTCSFSHYISVDLILKNINNFQDQQHCIDILNMFNQVVLFGGATVESNIEYMNEIMRDSFVDEIFSSYGDDSRKSCLELLQSLKLNEFVLLIKSEKIAIKDTNCCETRRKQ